MKPTPAMFNRLRAPAETSEGKAAAKSSQPEPAKAAPPEVAPNPVITDAPGRRRRRELLDTLLRSNKEQERVAIEEELARLGPQTPSRPRGPASDVGRALEGLVLESRTPATPGVVAVRVTGAGANEEKVPLEGLRVRATLNGKSSEGLTEATGQALVFLGDAGSFEVELLSDEGEVLQRAKGLLSPGKSVSLEVSVTERPELADRFARGRAYLEAVRQRAERIPSLQAGDSRALEQRVATLEATVARLEQALAQLTRGDTKSTQDTKEPKGGAQ
jgi:hypothetical protein